MVREGFRTLSVRTHKMEQALRIARLKDKRLSENPSMNEIFESLLKIATREAEKTGEEAETGIVVTRFEPTPAESASVPDSETLPSPATVTEPTESEEKEIPPNPKVQVQPTLLSWNQDFMQRRLLHQQAVLELEEKKFNWRVEAFDRRMEFESDRLALAREIVNMKKHRNELEERIITDQHGSRSDEVLCTYCGKRHSNSGCPQLIADRQKWQSWDNRGRPNVIDVTPSALSDLSDHK